MPCMAYPEFLFRNSPSHQQIGLIRTSLPALSFQTFYPDVGGLSPCVYLCMVCSHSHSREGYIYYVASDTKRFDLPSPWQLNSFSRQKLWEKSESFLGCNTGADGWSSPPNMYLDTVITYIHTHTSNQPTHISNQPQWCYLIKLTTMMTHPAERFRTGIDKCLLQIPL